MITAHAKENSKRYAKHLTKSQAHAFSRAIVDTMINATRPTAVVIELAKAVQNDFRDDWAPNDRLVGIVRHGDLVTVMLSRKSQMNWNHLRVNKILFV